MELETENVQERVSRELNMEEDNEHRCTRRNGISKEMRQRSAMERAAKNVAAWSQLQASMRNYKDDIARISAENNINENLLKQKALHVSVLRPSRQTNSYNAFRRFVKIDLKKVDFGELLSFWSYHDHSGRVIGMSDEQRTSLIQLQSLPVEEGYAVFKDLSDDIKDLVTLMHDQYRLQKNANARGSRKTIGQNFRHSVERISAEVS